MGKWLNGAQVRKREIDGKDTRIAALAARVEPGSKRSNQYLKRGIAPTGVIYMHIR